LDGRSTALWGFQKKEHLNWGRVFRGEDPTLRKRRKKNLHTKKKETQRRPRKKLGKVTSARTPNCANKEGRGFYVKTWGGKKTATGRRNLRPESEKRFVQGGSPTPECPAKAAQRGKWEKHLGKCGCRPQVGGGVRIQGSFPTWIGFVRRLWVMVGAGKKKRKNIIHRAKPESGRRGETVGSRGNDGLSKTFGLWGKGEQNIFATKKGKEKRAKNQTDWA